MKIEVDGATPSANKAVASMAKKHNIGSCKLKIAVYLLGIAAIQ